MFSITLLFFWSFYLQVRSSGTPDASPVQIVEDIVLLSRAVSTCINHGVVIMLLIRTI